MNFVGGISHCNTTMKPVAKDKGRIRPIRIESRQSICIPVFMQATKLRMSSSFAAEALDVVPQLLGFPTDLLRLEV